MAGNGGLEKCSRDDGNKCLMNKHGRCRALRATENCKFFKDKTKMSLEEVLAWENEDWKKGYIGCSKETARKHEEIGERILRQKEAAK